MICPHCSIAELPDDGGACPLCGFSPSGSVLIERRVVDEVLEYIQDVVADQFQIRAVLGLGAHSFVYLARDIARNRLVALKVLPAVAIRDATMVQQFERQAALYGSLQHAQIVPLVAYGVARSFLWYTMEPARGRPLATVLREAGPMEADVCLNIARQVAAALAYAHHRSVIHGSLKPTNIFLDEDRVQVGDFAMWGVWSSGSLKAGKTVLPEPEYRAPEHVLRRGVTPAADQYALGILAFQCLTGTLPFVGDSDDEVAWQHASAAPPPLAALRPELPLYMAEAVARALAKDPAQRFPGVMEFAAALSGPTAAPATAHASPAPQRPTPSRLLTVEPDPEEEADRAPARRRRGWLAALGVVLIGGIGGGVVWQRRHEQPPPKPITQADFVRDSTLLRAMRDTLRPPPLPPSRPITPAAAAGLPAAASPAAASPAPVAAAAAEPAHLFVNATPWGRVYVDGQLIGNTPRANIPVPPGIHRVRVVQDGFRPFEQVIQPTAGEVVRLTGIVLQPEQQ